MERPHHKDEVKLNDHLSNLELKEHGEHTRDHHTLSGITLTCEHCDRQFTVKTWRLAQRKREGQSGIKYCSQECYHAAPKSETTKLRHTLKALHWPIERDAEVSVVRPNSRILCTGATGFLGSHLMKRLAAHEPYSTSRQYANLLDAKAIEALFKVEPAFNFVVHLAATVGGIGFNQANPVRCLNENLLMSTNLFRAMEQKPPGKFIALGSVCGYPKYTPVPFMEEDFWNGYPEETNAPYGLAKRILLAQCQAYRQQGLNAIYLLPANMFGPNDKFDLDNSHVIPVLIRKCIEARDKGGPVRLWGSGEATRDFLYIEDCVDAIVLAMENYDSGQPVNIGTGRETSIREVAEMIAEIIGVATHRLEFDPSRPDGQPRRVLDTSRAKEFGFTAKTSLEDGLRKTIEWYESTTKERENNV